MPTLCATFRKEAGVVWNRMDTAARLGLSLSEETLTESSLYDIALAHQGRDFKIDLASKPAESKHGADWEWWFIRGARAFPFRVQAKRLFRNGLYQALYKPGPNRYDQLDRLVRVSKNANCIPLYCFFNFPHPRFNGFNKCRHDYRRPSFWGCTLAFPHSVRQAQSNKVKDLSDVMYPWHMLVCQSDRTDLLGAASNFVRDVAGRDYVVHPQVIPDRVSRLIEMSDRVRPDGYLDDAYWAEESSVPDDISGLVVLRDLRED